MQFRIGILIGMFAGFLLAGLWCKRRERREPVDRWQYRLDELDSLYAEEKATENLGRRYDKRN